MTWLGIILTHVILAAPVGDGVAAEHERVHVEKVEEQL